MRLLVTGAARSGTTYVAEVLRHLGVDCCHECSGTGTPMAEAEASWLAAAHLDDFDGYAVHLVRDPRRVVASLVSNGTFSPDRPYVAWALRRFPHLSSIDDPLERACAYVELWDRLASRHAHDTWHVERLPENMVASTLRLVGLSVTVDDVRRAKAAVPDDVNTRGETAELDWGDLTLAVRGIGRRHGYA